jgi:capsular exopolysaccharide synthesis family protein
VVPPKYTSSGRVSIAPTKTVIMYQNELNEPMTSFDSHVQSQANTLRGSRVMDTALRDPEMAKVGWLATPEGMLELQDGLSVVALNRQQDIFVSVTHEEPAKAKAAVNAVLDAYAELAINQEASEITDTLNELDQLARDFLTQSEGLREQAFRIAESEGTDDLERRRNAKHEQVEMLDQMITQREVELLPYRSIVSGASQPGDTSSSESLPIDVLAQSDPMLARLLDQQRGAELQLQSLQSKYTEGHRAVIKAKQELETVQQMIDHRARSSQDAGPNTNGTPQAMSPVAIATQMRSELAEIRGWRDTAAEEAKRLGKLQLQIVKYREQAARADEQYRLAQSRYDMLKVEQGDGQIGRIRIAEYGKTPLRASTDRRLPLAVLGAMGGGGVGVALIAAIGFVFPKYRYINDLDEATRNVFVYGAVPELDAADAESKELVASSVHQVRSVIDARLLGTSKEALVHAITSAGAGEGKSTISIRLAKSFAATGRRTLLIDADMIGRRLSAEFGQINSGGFADAVTARGSADQTVHETPVRDLSFMPCGRIDRVEPEEISARRVADLLAPLRQVYQAIVIDTGPVLGSLEAQAVAAVADEIMLVVTRGREVRSVKLAIDRLHHLGAKRIGVVFNRATRHDIERSTSISATSQRTSDVRSNWDQTDAFGREDLNGHGRSGTNGAVARLESAGEREH